MFIRDKKTKMIVNTDDSEYRAILAEREAERVKAQLEELQKDFMDIKKLLVERLNGQSSS